MVFSRFLIGAASAVALVFALNAGAQAHSSAVKNAPEQVVKQKRGEAKQASEAVNLNTADAKTLATLKGIGPKRAEAIIAYRKQHGAFKDVNGLANVKGFNKNAVARLLDKNSGRIVVK